MSLFDITPLIKEVQAFNQKQHQIIALLEEQNQLLKKLFEWQKKN